MDIPNASGKAVQNVLREKLPIRAGDEEIGVQSAELVHVFADLFGLENGNTKGLRRRFHRRWGEYPFSALWFVDLGDNADDLKAVFVYFFEWHNRKIGRAGEDEFHGIISNNNDLPDGMI